MNLKYYQTRVLNRTDINVYPAKVHPIYLLKVNNKKHRYEICSKLKIKPSKRRYWLRTGNYLLGKIQKFTWNLLALLYSGAYRENSKGGSKFGVKGHFLPIRLFSSVYSLNQKVNWNWKGKQQNVFSKVDISTKN